MYWLKNEGSSVFMKRREKRTVHDRTITTHVLEYLGKQTVQQESCKMRLQGIFWCSISLFYLYYNNHNKAYTWGNTDTHYFMRSTCIKSRNALVCRLCFHFIGGRIVYAMNGHPLFVKINERLLGVMVLYWHRGFPFAMYRVPHFLHLHISRYIKVLIK